MANIRIPFIRVLTQSPFSFDFRLTQALFALYCVQNNDFIQRKPSVTHEFLWALGVVMPRHLENSVYKEKGKVG